MSVQLLEGDAMGHLQAMKAGSIAACVTDPPYGLKFMGRAWDHGIPGEPYWREVLRVLAPGGHLVAFGGTRTHHRLMVAIEDAGFEIRDCFMWLYGSGFPKGKACLKPGWEPIVLARKKGASPWLNVDGCRLTPGDGGDRSGEVSADRIYGETIEYKGFTVKPGPRGGSAAGRWPANVMLDKGAAALLDEQSGTLSSNSGKPFSRNTDKFRTAFGEFKGQAAEQGFYGDTGGASRFYYVAKASPAERRPYNDHPTVKPLALMQWLVRLVTPKGGTVLDPFCGSGSTLIAADREGFDAVGIDSDPHAIEIARRRVEDDAGPLLAEVMP